MMYNDWPGWGGWLAMGLMMLAFVGLVVVVALVFVRSLNGPQETTARPITTESATAQRLLDERFARGEIDAEDYIRRRDLLRSPSMH